MRGKVQTVGGNHQSTAISHDDVNFIRQKKYYEKIEKSMKRKELEDRYYLEQLKAAHEKRNGSVALN